jgi:hypothetical protein
MHMHNTYVRDVRNMCGMHAYTCMHTHTYTSCIWLSPEGQSYACMYTYIHAYMHTCMFYIHAYTHTHIHAYIHTYTFYTRDLGEMSDMRAYMHVCIHTYMHVMRSQALVHAHINVYKHTHIHMHMHESTNTYMYTSAHTASDHPAVQGAPQHRAPSIYRGKSTHK